MSDLDRYIKAFKTLNVNRAHGKVSPHKMCMLLAVIDLFDGHPDRPNQIQYEPQLLDRFHGFFNTVRAPGDHPHPYFPFFHLKSEGFWRLNPKAGREAVLAGLTTARTAGQITENVESVSLDEGLYALLKEPEAREVLAETLVQHWFDRRASELREMVSRGRQINRYEERLRRFEPTEKIEEAPPQYIRDPAFRRVVLEACDYRCAAGTRIILPDESVSVQAALIEPFKTAAGVLYNSQFV